MIKEFYNIHTPLVRRVCNAGQSLVEDADDCITHHRV
jgi:hypothetical protein